MHKENIPEKKLKKLTGNKDLSTAIEKLERKKEAMENDFKDEAHHFLDHLNPITMLDHTLQNVKKSSSSKYALFKQALALGAGYLSKRKVSHDVKSALIKTFFRSSVSRTNLILETASESHHDIQINGTSTANKKENNYMSSNNETVKAKPEVLPEPTYWPFFVAMGLAFLGWGLLTTWLISLAGFIILVVALTGWINILRHE